MKINGLDKYKQAVLEEYLSTNNNIFMNATAGAGKSYMLLKLLEATPFHKDCLFLAFNKSIVRELEQKIIGRAEVKTIHSKAYSVLLKNSNVRFNISKWRDYAICKKYLHFPSSLSDSEMNAQILNLSRMYNLIRMNLIDVENKTAVEEMCLRWDIAFNDPYYENIKLFVQKVNEETHNLRVQKLDIDFTDQLYLTYKHIPGVMYPKYDVIFLDEAQDLNVLQRELVLRMLKPNGRLITAGDFHQCIYSFMGSSSDSFAMLRDRPNTVSLPLNLTYRCAKNIVEVAKKYSPEIEALEGAKDGIVREGTHYEVREGDYVLCRNNLPLVSLFIEFLKMGKRAVILGKDYGEGLLSLLEKVDDIEQLAQILVEKRQELHDKGIKNVNNNESYIALKEKVDILYLLYRYTPLMPAIKKVIENLFTENTTGQIILSTIHKSKGLEADRVFILGFNELLPSKYATTEFQLEAEKCLQFVAVTRAKKELVFIPYKGQSDEKQETKILH